MDQLYIYKLKSLSIIYKLGKCTAQDMHRHTKKTKTNKNPKKQK